MKTKPPVPIDGKATSIKDPVAAKAICPDFEAGFLHVASSLDFNGIDAAVKKLNTNQSIYTDMPSPQQILDKEEYQYVNLPDHDDEFRDTILGTNDICRADRVGRTPRILVRFKEKKSFRFNLELVSDDRNITYYDDEIIKNKRFEQLLSNKKGYQTNSDGYLVIDDLFLNAAGGNFYTIKVEVTEPGYEGVLTKKFSNGVIKTARYIWMLSVVGGNGRWTPIYSHAQCRTGTIFMYFADAHIHINTTRLKEYSTDIECFEDMEYTWEKQSKLFVDFLDKAIDKFGNPCPDKLKKYTFVALLIRFRYKRIPLRATGNIPFDGNKHIISMKGVSGVVEPIPENGTPYLIKSYAEHYDPDTRTTEVVELDGKVVAINGFGKTSSYEKNGHIGCTNFEVDTTGLPPKDNMAVVINFHGMQDTTKGGAHWGDHENNLQSGFCMFTAQAVRGQQVLDKALVGLSNTFSHELGHAMQMATKGNSTKPNAIVSYYDNNDEKTSWGWKYEETKYHSGPHCNTDFREAIEATETEAAKPTVYGTCLMFGQTRSNRFCYVTDNDKRQELITNKQNDCRMAIRKVSVYEPFLR